MRKYDKWPGALMNIATGTYLVGGPLGPGLIIFKGAYRDFPCIPVGQYESE